MRHARPIVLLVAFLVPAGIVGLAQARSRVVMRDGLMYKPHEFAVSGDGDFLVRGLRWRSWGQKTAVADGQAVEQVRPSHTDHVYPVQVTLSRRTYCAGLHRTVYNKITAHIVGPNPGVFGGRTLGRTYTCSGTWQLTAADRAAAAATHACSTSGFRPNTRSITAQGTSCTGARRVVRAWFRELKVPGNRCSWADGSSRPGACTVNGWRCVAPHTVDGHTYRVTCTADPRRRMVRFVNLV